MKPLYGDEPGLSMRLSAHFEQSYSGQIQMVCGVREPDDPAIEHVLRLKNERRESIELVISQEECGQNRKISNLMNMVRLAQHDVFVIADSDIGVDKYYLESLMAYLHDEKVGIVTCLYHGAATESIWSQQEALAINSHFLPNVILAVSFDLARPCLGSTIAIRRETLESIGGFRRFSNQLADDFEIGRSVRQAGYRVAIPKFTVAHHCHSNSLSALFAREMRAARTIRCIDPLGYFGAAITHPFPFALIGMISFGYEGGALAVFALVLRVLLCRSVERAFALRNQSYHLIPLHEIISFVAFWSSFTAPRINWRGHEFHVTAGGELKEVRMGKEESEFKTRRC